MVLGTELRNQHLPLLLCGHLLRKLVRDTHRGTGTGKGFDLDQVHTAYPKITKVDGILLVSY